MKVRRVSLQNTRSFLEHQDLELDGDISILIGPNGGGKTNLLDAAVLILRRHLLTSMWLRHRPRPEKSDRFEFQENDAFNNITIEKHTSANSALDQVIEVELEVSAQDIDNIGKMRSGVPELRAAVGTKYVNTRLKEIENLDSKQLHNGQRFVYRLKNGRFEHENNKPLQQFLNYLKLFEIDAILRDECEMAPLSMPMIYLPVNRSSSGFEATVQLASFNSFEQKKQVDAIHSKSTSSLVPLAIGRLAQKFRLLLERDKGTAAGDFYGDPSIQELSHQLANLGYDWRLVCTDPLKNQYDVRLGKQGSSFLVGSASSGERELLTYLFAIFALNVRNALIVVDEPELHLHPKWQKSLLDLFVNLAKTTGNQFLLATHSATFVAPRSIEYVTRVYSDNQRSRLVRLNNRELPDVRHLFNIVNSQNNERLFFADKVILVEGLSDRIVFEKLLSDRLQISETQETFEVIPVGGKGLFQAYLRLLKACRIPHALVADRDYIEQVGTPEIKRLFVLNDREVKRDVIDNPKSTDGASLVTAIESAISGEGWSDAREVWEYIKSRRRCLKLGLSYKEAKKINRFILDHRRRGIYILKLGALEDYLPEGYRSKDIGKLIELVQGERFWSRLSIDAQTEIQQILDSLVSSSASCGVVFSRRPSYRYIRHRSFRLKGRLT